MRTVKTEWIFEEEVHKPFTIYFFFNGWTSIQLGIHFDLKNLNFQLHIPFGFIHVGREMISTSMSYKITVKPQ